VRRLAVHYPDATVAGILNRQGRRSATGQRFTATIVQGLRHHWHIPRHQPSAEPPEGELLTVTDAARELGVVASTVHRWSADGFIAGEQLTPGAPWRIRMTAQRGGLRPVATRERRHRRAKPNRPSQGSCLHWLRRASSFPVSAGTSRRALLIAPGSSMLHCCRTSPPRLAWMMCSSGGSYEPVPAPTLRTVRASPSAAQTCAAILGSVRRVTV
jgi:hypothetical protein